MAKHWDLMGPADPEVVIRSIIDPGCLHLQLPCLEAVDLVKEVPEALKFIHDLPEKQWRREEKIIMSIFDHTSEALAHPSTTAAHFSSLAKITDGETLYLVMNAAIWPLVQLNLPEKFLNPVANAVPMTTEEQRRVKVERTILPRHDMAYMKHEPKNGPTQILAAAVWLKLKTSSSTRVPPRRHVNCLTWGQSSWAMLLWAKSTLGAHRRRGPKSIWNKEKVGRATLWWRNLKKKRRQLLHWQRRLNHRKVRYISTWHHYSITHLHWSAQLTTLLSKGQLKCHMSKGQLKYHMSNRQPKRSSITIGSYNAFIPSSAQKSSRGMASSLICHIIHPFICSSYRWHIVGLFHNSPVTTRSCLPSILNHVVITTVVMAT